MVPAMRACASGISSRQRRREPPRGAVRLRDLHVRRHPQRRLRGRPRGAARPRAERCAGCRRVVGGFAARHAAAHRHIVHPFHAVERQRHFGCSARQCERPAAQPDAAARGIGGDARDDVADRKHGGGGDPQARVIRLIARQRHGGIDLRGCAREAWHQTDGRHACGAGGIAGLQSLEKPPRDPCATGRAGAGQGVDVKAVGDQHLDALPEGGGHRGAVRRRRDVVELAGHDQRRNVRIGSVDADLRGGAARRRNRPGDALVEETVVERHGPVLIDGEGCIGVRRAATPLRQQTIAFGGTLRRRQPHVEDLRRILAHDGGRQTGAPARRVGGGIARIHRGRGLGHQPQQRCAVAGREGTCRRIGLAHAGRGRCAAVHLDGELCGVRLDAPLAAVAVGRPGRKRVRPQLLQGRQYVLDRGARQRRTRREARAGEIELGPHRRCVARIPGVIVPAERIGAVEDNGAQRGRMTDSEHLFEVGAVGIAVQIDLAHAERLQDRGQVIGGIRGAVQRGALAERLAACRDCLDGPLLRGLQRAAIDGARRTGAAVVHEDDVAIQPQRREQGQVIVPRAGGGVARPALRCHQRPLRRTGAGVRIVFEVDRDAVRQHLRRIERALEPSAEGAPRAAGLQVERADPLDRHGLGRGGPKRRPGIDMGAAGRCQEQCDGRAQGCQCRQCRARAKGPATPVRPAPLSFIVSNWSLRSNGRGGIVGIVKTVKSR